ncbi:MAG TPA: peptidoglycan-binding domain-containing protein [Candidatus Paceibacterota bacterium]|nr:peptidoglycan-binding domain-containing protein [Candidatus Paceibacterota bacterium]
MKSRAKKNSNILLYRVMSVALAILAVVIAYSGLMWSSPMAYAQIVIPGAGDIICIVDGQLDENGLPILNVPECEDDEEEPPVDACPHEETDPGHQDEGPCNEDDVCPNDDGIQTNESECTPDEVEDKCPNIDGTQESVPDGKEIVDGNCVDKAPQGGGGGGGGAPTPPSGGGGGGGGGGVISGPLAPGSVNTNPTGGTVLGTSTQSGACGLYLTSYLRMGDNNDPEEVKKLQTFLNQHMNENLPVTGYFGIMTYDAVRRFQQKYTLDVLKPWQDAGLMDSLTPTGYVYKTTQRMINNLQCSGLNLPVPQLP